MVHEKAEKPPRHLQTSRGEDFHVLRFTRSRPPAMEMVEAVKADVEGRSPKPCNAASACSRCSPFPKGTPRTCVLHVGKREGLTHGWLRAWASSSNRSAVAGSHEGAVPSVMQRCERVSQVNRRQGRRAWRKVGLCNRGRMQETAPNQKAGRRIRQRSFRDAQSDAADQVCLWDAAQPLLMTRS